MKTHEVPQRGARAPTRIGTFAQDPMRQAMRSAFTKLVPMGVIPSHNMGLTKRKGSSSNQQFSEGMLVSGRVEIFQSPCGNVFGGIQHVIYFGLCDVLHVYYGSPIH